MDRHHIWTLLLSLHLSLSRSLEVILYPGIAWNITGTFRARDLYPTPLSLTRGERSRSQKVTEGGRCPSVLSFTK